ncbi:class I SAM-dependent RNA methyltransferase [Gloeocapsa sp. PCC 73106]|uniref:THUMP domain-containing class I SAM-dependent RNA methyltransferase n=1 Tax=Gloeocapsa sp. PCC 73106 TaxID=102232 RepID=UPI0002AC9109|nr:THUMP domain-containing protein [Gloeocapsa sp. PCC 73106]ELR97779.1 putative N6-adenine-specific DNA methylase [Gloeocapsa sp. PCC 73106]
MTQYFATVARGLEAIASQELTALGAKDVQEAFTGVSFTGDKSLLYRVNLWVRTIFHVLMPIKTIKCADREQLYQQVRSIDWREYLSSDRTFAVNCTGGNPQLNHTHYSALQIKNAIVDQQREQGGQRSSIDIHHPDLLINAHITGDNCILSLDSSGESLHRRGYRPAMGLAPLKETLAAGLLELAQWRPGIAFFDPLCGSGTLPIEATLKALNIAPGLYRERFGFESWSDFDPDLWQQLRTEAKKSQLSQLRSPIVGSEADSNILKQAQHNAQLCGVQDHIQLLCHNLATVSPPCDSGIIITNPPYGKRIGEVTELASLYQLLGNVLKQRFRTWRVYVLTGNQELAKKIGLKPSRRFKVYNGNIPCNLLEFEMF